MNRSIQLHFVTTNFRKIVFYDSTSVKRTLLVEKIKAGLERRDIQHNAASDKGPKSSFRQRWLYCTAPKATVQEESSYNTGAITEYNFLSSGPYLMHIHHQQGKQPQEWVKEPLHKPEKNSCNVPLLAIPWVSRQFDKEAYFIRRSLARPPGYRSSQHVKSHATLPQSLHDLK